MRRARSLNGHGLGGNFLAATLNAATASSAPTSVDADSRTPGGYLEAAIKAVMVDGVCSRG